MRHVIRPSGRRGRHGHGCRCTADLGRADEPYVELRPSVDRRQLVRQALALARDHSRSPQETRMRLSGSSMPASRRRCATSPCSTWTVGCWAIPTCSIRSRAWWASTTGPTTRTCDRRRSDVAREERFRDHGLEYFDRGRRVTSGTGSRRAADARSVRGRARFDAPDVRRWTLDATALVEPRRSPSTCTSCAPGRRRSSSGPDVPRLVPDSSDRGAGSPTRPTCNLVRTIRIY